MHTRVLILALLVFSAASFAEEEKFIVHEWGVLLRNSTTSGNCFETSKEMVALLPDFVKTYSMPQQEMRIWYKPVLHFYGRDGLAIDVTIRTAKGIPTVYWPQPTITAIGQNFDMRWTGTLSAKEPGSFNSVRKDHWWNIARRVPGKYVNTAQGNERFIFYEATALQEPLVTATVAADAITVNNADTEESGQVLMIVNDGDTRRWATLKRIPAKGSLALKPEAIVAGDASGEALLAACRAQWESYGMTREEAAAMVEVWKEDILKTEGFLMISRMPEAYYRAMFPLSVTPQPDEIVRAGVVFDTLPDEKLRLKWMPKLEAKLEKLATDLKDDEFNVRDNAQKSLTRYGELAKELLTRTEKSDDAEARAAARKLLEKLKPQKPREAPSIDVSGPPF